MRYKLDCSPKSLPNHLRRRRNVRVEVVRPRPLLHPETVPLRRAFGHDDPVPDHRRLHASARHHRMRQLRHPLLDDPRPACLGIIRACRQVYLRGAGRENDDPEPVVRLRQDPKAVSASIHPYRRSNFNFVRACTHQLPSIRPRHPVVRRLRIPEVRARPHDDLILLDRRIHAVLERAREVRGEREPRCVRKAVNPRLRVGLGALDGPDVVRLAVVCTEKASAGLAIGNADLRAGLGQREEEEEWRSVPLKDMIWTMSTLSRAATSCSQRRTKSQSSPR